MKIDKGAITKVVAPAKNVLILSPDSPDHDSVSSNIALAETLKAMGKRVQLLASAPTPEDLTWILGSWKYLSQDQWQKLRLRPDLTVITDIGGMSQVQQAVAGIERVVKDTPTLLIDHHATRDDFKFSVAVIDPEAAATGELLYSFYKAVGWEVTPAIARLMMIGILGDTASFQNLNVDAEVFKVATALVEHGARVYDINQEYIQSSAFTPEKFYVLAKLAAAARFDGPIAYGLIPYAKVAKFGTNAGFTHALGSQIRYLKGVRVSFVISEKADGSLRLSMRSQPEFDVSKVASHFGGGGHKVAAGGSIEGKQLEQAAKEVVALIKKQIK